MCILTTPTPLCPHGLNMAPKLINILLFVQLFMYWAVDTETDV